MTKITALPPGMAVGFRFHPTEEELITNYLIPKILGTDADVDNVIADVDFYKFEPWELPFQSKIESTDQMWLFFCKPEYKRPISKQSKRSTKEGSWTITGKERLIKNQETKKCIGKKRTLVFFRGKGSKRGERTNWVFHEYFIDDNRFPNQNSYVLCRLKKKVNSKANTLNCGEGNPSRNINMSEVEDSLTPGVTSTSWAHGHQEAIQKLSSQPLYSPDCNRMEDFIGETNTGEAEEQYVMPDSGIRQMYSAEAQGFIELQAAGGVSSTEMSESGRVVLEGGRPDMFLQATAEMSEGAHVVLEGGRPNMFFQAPQGFTELQAAIGVSSTEMSESGHVVLEGGRPNMFFRAPQGFVELQAANGVSSTETSESGRVVLEGGRPDLFLQGTAQMSEGTHVVLEGGRPNMFFRALQRFVELQAANGVSSTETSESGYVVPDSGIHEAQSYSPRRHRRRGIQVRDSISFTEMSGNERVVLEGGRPDMFLQATVAQSAEAQAYNPRRHRRRGIQAWDSISSTEMSGNEVGEEAATNNSISASDFCAVAVVIISMILTAVFVLLVFGTCKLALLQLRRKRTLVVALCSVLFFWVYNYRNMPGVSGRNAVELNPTAGMLQ